ncbi:MAG: thioredoxin family protein [Spirochaetales bacterium]|nr:thioredoxin family protein [Spirochaetales bacterium]
MVKKTTPSLLLLVILFSVITGCAKTSGNSNVNNQSSLKDNNLGGIKATFVELGSVKCIPCKMMQPIMEEIKKEYAGQVDVVFYDVWTPEGKPFAAEYNIRVIPTQVFLDAFGNEYFRHEGFFPKEELVKILKKQGVK